MDMTTPMTNFNAQHEQFNAEAYRKRIEGLFMAEWKPIDTAPMDGTHFIGYVKDIKECAILKAHRRMKGFEDVSSEDYFPTSWVSHWMPLPKPPEATDE